jgi:hypothetical protein
MTGAAGSFIVGYLQRKHTSSLLPQTSVGHGDYVIVGDGATRVLGNLLRREQTLAHMREADSGQSFDHSVLRRP